MDKPIQILHLEDNANDAQLIQAILRKSGVIFDYFFVDNQEDYLHILKNKEIDIILSDYHLPGYNGRDALLVAKKNYPQIPFVFISGTMGEEAAIDSLLNGATDYVLKNRMERLGQAVKRAYKEAQEQRARKNAEMALLQSEENFHRTIAESPLGIRIVSLNGKTIYANKAYLDIYEYASLEEYFNTPAQKRYTPKSYEEHLIRKEKRKRGEEVLNYELSIIAKNGEIRYINVSRKEILWNGSKHYQVINQDITEQKNLTLQLIEAKNKAEESDRLKTSFLHNISHEIRTPMNAIIGFSGLLNDPDLSPEKRVHFTNIIVQSSNQLLSIITDIVSIATIEAGQVKVLEKEFDILDDMELLYVQFLLKAAQQNIRLSHESSLRKEEAMILSDETKVVQIMTNLINNALKFTKEGYILYGCRKVSDVLEFFVEDTGIGIPESKHEEIFKRFSQVDNSYSTFVGGSGLGLSISKAYVEILGGRIWLKSEPGKGTCFFFTIPYKSNIVNKPSLEPIHELDISISGKPVVLIAEDEDSNFLYLNEILSVLNCKIIRAKNGLEAVSKCVETSIDLVLMDLKMPVMDGYEASIRIKEINPSIPIIAQSAYISEIDRQKALDCGCSDFISKPIHSDMLINKILEYFNKGPYKKE